MKPGCCAGAVAVALEPRTLGAIEARWSDGTVATPVGPVPRVRARLDVRDRLGTLMVRSGFGRSRYRLAAGLYALGAPTPASPVLLSANYKLSFDHLRRGLAGRDAWILVLDTRGINVWCAAGKGTFGTDELVHRVRAAALSRVVTHRKLVAPQLAAPGIAAHEVRRATGFHVSYGPVRAADLPAFLEARMTATPEMRRVRFGWRDRLTLVPVEVTTGARYAFLLALVLLLLGGFGPAGYSLSALARTGVSAAGVALALSLATQVLGPVLLPWLPGRAFAVKGAALGVILVGALLAAGAFEPGLSGSWHRLLAWSLLGPALSSFLLMNFTGATTFTSLSGVLKEMRLALPAQAVAALAGLALWVVGLFAPGGLR